MKTVRNIKKSTAPYAACTNEVANFRKVDGKFSEAVNAYANADETDTKALALFRDAVDSFCHALANMYNLDNNFFDTYQLEKRQSKI